MAEHTPGPWRFEQETYGNFAILANQGPLEVCPAHVHSLGDASLIAAAPELLAALEAIDERGRAVGNDRDLATYEAALGDCCQIARSAIAKARGAS